MHAKLVPTRPDDGKFFDDKVALDYFVNYVLTVRASKNCDRRALEVQSMNGTAESHYHIHIYEYAY